MGDKFIPGVPSIDSAMQVIGNVARNAVGNPSVPFKSTSAPNSSLDPNQSANGPYNFAAPNYGLKKPADDSAFTTDDLKPRRFNNAGGSAGGLNYNVNTFTYPEKTAGTADLQHYMVFFINLRGKSKYVKKYTSVPISTGGQNTLPAGGKVEAGVDVIGAVGGLGVGRLISKAANLTGIKKVITAIGSVGAGVGAADTINDSLQFFKPDQSRRISRAIMLAVNQAPEARYGVTYEGTELGSLVGFLSGGSSAADLLAGQQNRELGLIAALSAASLPGAVADLFGSRTDFGAALQAGTAQAPNPFREQIFRNVQNREFTFKYKFLPRTASEAQAVRNIIKEFKLNMHPEISTGGLFYVYPSTFDIAYYFNGTENSNISKISTCVLEDLAVDYGGQGFNTFNDGMPTEVNLSLKFRELEVLTRERIEKGY